MGIALNHPNLISLMRFMSFNVVISSTGEVFIGIKGLSEGRQQRDPVLLVQVQDPLPSLPHAGNILVTKSCPNFQSFHPFIQSIGRSVQ